MFGVDIKVDLSSSMIPPELTKNIKNKRRTEENINTAQNNIDSDDSSSSSNNKLVIFNFYFRQYKLKKKKNDFRINCANHVDQVVKITKTIYVTYA